MSGWTNKGKSKCLVEWTRNNGAPTGFYVALVTSATAPDADINTLGQLTEIASGNGYSTGGLAVARNATDWDTETQDNAGDLGKALVKDLVWTASGGNLPSSGSGARYAVMTDDNATIASREVYHFWDLSSDRLVSVGQTITLQDLEVRLTE